jgi:predicted nuclease of predicted toxin-antitoxin system
VFLDNSLGRRVVAEALRRANARVEVLSDHLAENAPDQDWLELAGTNKWIVRTKDERIRYRKNEYAAVRRNGVKMFVITARNLTGNDLATLIVRALPKIHAFVEVTSAPFIAKLDRAGEIVLYAQSLKAQGKSASPIAETGTQETRPKTESRRKR